MKDFKLTEIMLKSLMKDPSLATYEEWMKAGSYAAQIRFFPHSFNCLQNAFEIDKNEDVADKLNSILDKITNVLEIVPEALKHEIKDIRFNKPLDPAQWLAISNKLLREAAETGDFSSARIALAFTIYCSARVGIEVSEMNEILAEIVDKNSSTNLSPKTLTITGLKEEEPYRVVAFGDNVTLGLQKNWEVTNEETYHYLWGKESGEFVSVANCGVSGAGSMDAFLYLGRDVMNYKPQTVFINFGINDAWLGKEVLLAFEVLYEGVVELLKPHMDVVIITPVPHIPENCPKEQRPTDLDLSEVQIESWVEACRRVAYKTDVVLADAYQEFPKDLKEREKLLANGFNQPNLEGHKLILNSINKVVKFA